MGKPVDIVFTERKNGPPGLDTIEEFPGGGTPGTVVRHLEHITIQFRTAASDQRSFRFRFHIPGKEKPQPGRGDFQNLGIIF